MRSMLSALAALTAVMSSHALVSVLDQASPLKLFLEKATIGLLLLQLILVLSAGMMGEAKKESKEGADAMPTADQVELLIRSRRSVFPKDYNGEAPPKELVARMLNAANWAPTHGKTEPWRFVVMSGEAVARFNAAVFEAQKAVMGGGSEAFKKWQAKQERKAKDKAKVAFLVAIGMKRKAHPEKIMPEWEELAATSCAVQNLHLMATSLGVAGYWSSGGPLEDDMVKAFLGLEKEDKWLGLFHLGMASKETVAAYRSKRGPLDEKVNWLE